MSQLKPSAPLLQPDAGSDDQPELSPNEKMLLLEEYKIFVEDTARFSERRQTITNTYISVNSAIAGFLAFLVKDSGLTGWLLPSAIISLIVFGLAICRYWAQLIFRYKALVRFRIDMLREMENNIPLPFKMYHREDELYKPTTGKALNISDIEKRLPILFGILYVFLGIVLILTLLFDPAATRSTAQPVPPIIATPGAALPSPGS